MKYIITLLFIGIAFTSCQKDPVNPDTAPPQTGITDTSVVVTKKAASNYGQQDTVTTVYRRNMINGVKGYIITSTSKSDPGNTLFTYFRYDNSGNLIEIEDKLTGYPQLISKVIITWDQNRISRIKWDNSELYGMDRTYHYEMINDTLLISYAYNVGRDLYKDSLTVNIFAEKNFNKLYRIFQNCNFDFKPIFGEKGNYYNERIFNYSGNDISSINYYGETYFASPSAPHGYESFDAVCNFTRQQQVNPVLSDLENDLYGKEFKMLCYDDASDTLSYFLNDFFEYTGINYNVPNFGNTSQNFVQSHSALGASVAPLLKASVSYKLETESGMVGQDTNLTYFDAVYTFDAAKRIKTVKWYAPGTNNLAVDYSFYYP